MKIKVVDLNLWNGGRVFQPMVEYLKNEKADINLLQEVYDGKQENLESRFQFWLEILMFNPTPTPFAR